MSAAADIKKSEEIQEEEIKVKIKRANALENVRQLEKYITSGDADFIVKTGFKNLDRALGGGLRNGRLYVLGAIPSLGKTTLALNIAQNIADRQQNVLFFSLEMSHTELTLKALCKTINKIEDSHNNLTSGLSVVNIMENKLDSTNAKIKKINITSAWDVYKKQAKHIYIEDGRRNVNVESIKKTIKNYIDTHNKSDSGNNSNDNLKTKTNPKFDSKPSLVIIDYLQILAYNSDNPITYNVKQNIDRNMIDLKLISKEFDLPILVISSFNRSNYMQEVGYESFKESGSIEYSSDVVMALQLHVEGCEKWTEKKPSISKKRELINEAKNQTPREIELHILKNRIYKAYATVNFNYYAEYEYFKDD
jgi:replicative DNA helicase